jgi:protein-tyrosine-phosphatase
MMGGRPAAEAVEIMAQQGLNLNEHESQPLTQQLVRQADLIVTMTRSHRQAILTEWPEAAGRVKVLCRDGGDVPDPIGGSPDHYRRCAVQLQAELDALIAHLKY